MSDWSSSVLFARRVSMVSLHAVKECFSVGALFTTRLTWGEHGGLRIPPNLPGAFTFVCELCSVRSVVVASSVGVPRIELC